MRWNCLLILSLSLPHTGLAQSAADLTGQLQHAFIAGNSAEANQDWRAAERAYREAIALALSANDREVEALALARLAAVQFVLSEPDSALANGRRSLTLAEEAGVPVLQGAALVEIAKVHAFRGRADSALPLFQRALSIMLSEGDSAAIAMVHQYVGNAHERLGGLDSALAHYRSSRHVWQALHNRAGEAGVLNAMGSVFQHQLEFDSMAAVARQSIVLFQLERVPDGEGRALLQFGQAQAMLGKTDSALAYYARARAVVTHIPDVQAEAEVLRATAELYRDLARTDSALTYGFLALDRARASGDPMVEANVQGLIGDVYSLLLVSRGMPADSALTRYQDALARFDSAQQKIGSAGTLIRMGLVLVNVGQPDSALVYLRMGRRLADSLHATATVADAGRVMGLAFGALGQFDSALVVTRQALGLARDAGDLLGAAGDLNILAHLHYMRAARAEDGTGRRADYAAAAAYFDSSSVVIASLRRSAGGDRNRMSVGEYGGGRNQERWVISLLRLGGPNAARDALAATERGRAQALRDLMQGGQGRNAAAVAVNPDPGVLRGRAGRSRTAVLDFLVASDSLMIWLLPPEGGVRFAAVPIRSDSLQALVARYRVALGVAQAGRGLRDIESPDRSGAAGVSGPGSAAETASIGRMIAAQVVPSELLPDLREVGDLVIVPHGPLSLLPFAALPLQGDTVPLGERFAVRYAPSLAALAAVEGRSQPMPGIARAQVFRKALVVGNPRMPRVTLADGTRASLSPLPDAEAEGRALATKLGVRPLSGDSAGEGVVRRRMATAPLIHLATHGFAYSNDARARESFVALAPDSVNDGLLTVGEILDDPGLRLTADLVALSACQTGLGDLKQAEGTVGLQRAFLARGARSVLVSLWSVSDAATSLLMQRFYAHWLDDRDHPGKGEALRRAQTDVRARAEYREPKYWAAFQLVGAN